MPAKKMRTKLAEPDGSGLPPKWIPDDGDGARAQRRFQRLKKQADQAGAVAKQTAQRERPVAEKKVEKNGDTPEEGEDDGVRFSVTLGPGRKPSASKKSAPEDSSSLSGSDPEDTQFEVTWTGSEDAGQSALVVNHTSATSPKELRSS